MRLLITLQPIEGLYRVGKVTSPKVHTLAHRFGSRIICALTSTLHNMGKASTRAADMTLTIAASANSNPRVHLLLFRFTRGLTSTLWGVQMVGKVIPLARLDLKSMMAVNPNSDVLLRFLSGLTGPQSIDSSPLMHQSGFGKTPYISSEVANPPANTTSVTIVTLLPNQNPFTLEQVVA